MFKCFRDSSAVYDAHAGLDLRGESIEDSDRGVYGRDAHLVYDAVSVESPGREVSCALRGEDAPLLELRVVPGVVFCVCAIEECFTPASDSERSRRH